MTALMIDEVVLADDYREALRDTSLRYGRIFAGTIILVMGAMFINDYWVMNVRLLAFTRLVAFIPGVIYLCLSSTLLKRWRTWIAPAHVALLITMLVSAGLFSVGLFRKGLPGSAYGAAGTMQAAVLAAFIFCNGVRKYLGAIIFVPLVLTTLAILVVCSPTRVEMTLFYTPFITGVCVVAAGVSQARLAAKNYRMSHLVELHKEELEEKAEALQLANNELQQFAGAVAHDLKVPLHSIRVALEGMDFSGCRDGADGTSLAEQKDFVTGAADRMIQMVASMLNYARLEDCSDEFDEVPLGEVLEIAKLNLKQAIADSHAEISAESLPTVWGDSMQLSMLLQELITNAIKYSKPGTHPTIRLAGEVLPDHVCVRVSDDGIGFDPAYRRKVFLPYQQLGSHAKDKGDGIGLASCAKIVKLHGGTISVDPVVDQGCTFTVTLPTSRSGDSDE